MAIHQFLAMVAILLLLGVFSSKLSSRINVPILLMFLSVGMLTGSDGLDWVSINSTTHAAPINFLGTVAMCFILYSGGLDTNYRSIKGVLGYGALLASAGVLITALLVGLGAWLLFGYDLKWCLLLGSIISSTDAAAVFAILRSKSVSLKGDLQPLLELESGSNDPMAAFLTLFMIGIVQGSDTTLWSFVPVFLAKMSIGIAGGYLIGRAGCWLFNKLKLEYEGLYFVTGVAIIIFAYGLTESLFGNGFMAVYVCGLTMGNRRYNFKKGLFRFSDGLAWLMQVTLFTTLGMLVNPHELFAANVWSLGLLLALVLMFIARPASIFLCLIGSRFTLRERTLVSWVGLRGAAPIVLATFPLVAHVERANMMFNMVFFIVLASVLIQGRTLMPVAKFLKLDRPLSDKPRIPLELEETDSINSEMYEFDVHPDAEFVNKSLAEMNLPNGVLVMLIRRGGHFILARGNTIIQANDGMLMMGDRPTLAKVAKQFFPDCDYDPS